MKILCFVNGEIILEKIKHISYDRDLFCDPFNSVCGLFIEGCSTLVVPNVSMTEANDIIRTLYKTGKYDLTKYNVQYYEE